MSQVYLKVALDVHFTELLDYLPPDERGDLELAPGMRVEVPLRRQYKVGVIVEICTQSDCQLELKQVVQVLDQLPLFSKEHLHFFRRVAAYYHYPLGQVIMGTLPRGLKSTTPPKLPFHFCITARGLAFKAVALQRAPKQKQLLERLKCHPEGIDAKFLIQQGYSRAVISALLEKGLVEKREQTERRAVVPTGAGSEPLKLTKEQQTCVDAILLKLGTFVSFLLSGVTGSGKTIVYQRVAHEVVGQGKQVLILVPEIALTPQTVSRFQQALLEYSVGVYHSGLSERERYLTWQQVREGKVKVLIGTRSAVFIPFQSLGLIVVDEEHDISFKQQEGFRYSARDLSILRARFWQIPVVLGSATPSLESWHNACIKRYHLLRMTQRVKACMPRILLYDTRALSLRQGLAPLALQHIEKHLEAGGQVLIFLNRRGYAPVLFCHHCGYMAVCSHCDARLTLHLNPHRLYCHHCGFARKDLTHCPKCPAVRLRPVGLGTERIEEFLADRFPGYNTLRVDSDSLSSKRALVSALSNINQGECQILIGTQMLAKGHDFPDLSLVVIVDADGGFFSTDFRASERMGQLLLQVAGRAGRAQRLGEVIIQTKQPGHPLFQPLIMGDYARFAQELLVERERTVLPPFSYLALLRCDAVDESAAVRFLRHTRGLMQEAASMYQVSLLGPVRAPMAKRKGRFRQQLLLQAKERSNLQPFLSLIMKQLGKQSLLRGVSWSLDVDPADLL